MKTVLMYKGFLLILLAYLHVTDSVAQPCYSTESNNPKEIKVGYHKTTTLVFKADIKDADRGSADVIIKPLKKFPHILKIKAARENFIPTNVTVYTADGSIFPIDVRYAADPTPSRYDFFNQVHGNNLHSLGFPGKLNEEQIKSFSEHISFFISGVKRPRNVKHQMMMSLRGVYIQDGTLFFKFHIRNNSNIPFDIAFVRFYEMDRSQSRRTSNMEKELQPVYSYFTKQDAIGARDYTTMVVAFEKFTIADSKFFMVKLFEQNGDRNLSLRLKGKHILRAKPVPEELAYAQGVDQ